MSTKRDVQIKGHQRLVRIVVGGIYGSEILVCGQFVKIVCGGITGVPWHRNVIFIEQSLIHLFNVLVFFAVWVLLSSCSTTMPGSVRALCPTRCLAHGNRGGQQQRTGVLTVIVCIMFGCKFTIMSLHVKSYIMRIFPHRLATNTRASPLRFDFYW